MVIIEPESLKNSKDPAVSIIVLNLNEPRLTADLVKGIHRTCKTMNVETIVVDNGSHKKNFELLLSLNVKATIIRLDENRFFGGGNNIAAEFARGNLLVFLNNDVVLDDGWLNLLVESVQKPWVGIAGAVFTDSTQQITEAGAKISPRGKATRNTSVLGWPLCRDTSELITDYVSAACLIISRQDFFALGGFDTRFGPAYFEDAELCIRMSEQLGKATVVSQLCRVTHNEGTTSKKAFSSLSLKVIKYSNRMLFLTRRQCLPSEFEVSRSENLTLEKVGIHCKRRVLIQPYLGARSKEVVIDSVLVGTLLWLLSKGYSPAVLVEERFGTLYWRQLLGGVSVESNLEIEEIETSALQVEGVLEAQFDAKILLHSDQTQNSDEHQEVLSKSELLQNGLVLLKSAEKDFSPVDLEAVSLKDVIGGINENKKGDPIQSSVSDELVIYLPLEQITIRTWLWSLVAVLSSLLLRGRRSVTIVSRPSASSSSRLLFALVARLSILFKSPATLFSGDFQKVAKTIRGPVFIIDTVRPSRQVWRSGFLSIRPLCQMYGIPIYRLKFL